MARTTRSALTGLITLPIVVPKLQSGLCCTVPSELKRTLCDRNQLLKELHPFFCYLYFFASFLSQEI
jgi:hypothetical protein